MEDNTTNRILQGTQGFCFSMGITEHEAHAEHTTSGNIVTCDGFTLNNASTFPRIKDSASALDFRRKNFETLSFSCKKKEF